MLPPLRPLLPCGGLLLHPLTMLHLTLRMTSKTALITKEMLLVSVAQVAWQYTCRLAASLLRSIKTSLVACMHLS